MNVGELLDQLTVFLDKGAVARETQVLADGCDCVGAARAAVVVQKQPRDVDTGDGKDRVAHLLVSREDAGHGDPPDGIRVADL